VPPELMPLLPPDDGPLDMPLLMPLLPDEEP
jgi:hypothetical protein